MKKEVIAVILLLVFVSVGIVYAIVNTDDANHSLENVLVFSNRGLDMDGNGIIDVCESLSEPSNPVDINLSKPSHSLDQISLTPSNFTSVDEDSNGWPDVCERTAPYLGVTFYNEEIVHPASQISRSSTNLQSIDSDGNGWVDKGDCILSELDFDVNNCGACGNVCATDVPCAGGVCEQPVWVRYWYNGMISSHNDLMVSGEKTGSAVDWDIVKAYAMTYCNEAPNGCSVESCEMVPYDNIVGYQPSFITDCSAAEYNQGNCYCGQEFIDATYVDYYKIFCRIHFCELV